MAYSIISNSERYVHFQNLNEKILAKLKAYATSNDRYFTMEEYNKKLYVNTKWEEHAKTFINHDEKSNEFNEWCEKNYPEYTKENIKNIKKINELSLMFYNDDIWGIHGHPGPLNYESTYIMDELKNFANTNFVAIDSEPGLLFDTHLQLPYITLFSTEDNFTKLFDVMKYSYIGVVQYPLKSCLMNIYNMNVENGEKYVEYTFGIDLNFVLCHSDYERFILTNKFFADILHMIDMIDMIDMIN
jgi:hypothetical protein